MSIPLSLKPVQPNDRDTSRGEFVYRVLRDAIKSGQLAQGCRVREEDLANSLGVSRTPVREALRRLQSRGLLELAPGRGLVVVQISRQQLLELYAMREVLEGGAARMAAQHASDSEVQALRDLMAELQTHVGDALAVARVNARFHAIIYGAAHNRYLQGALADLTDALALLPNTTFSAQGRPEAAHREHKAIVSAIANKDPEGAEEAARRHIRAAQRVRMEMIFATP